MPEFNKTSYAARVTTLKAPPPLTHDIELTADDQQRVDRAVSDVKRQGYGIIEGFLSPERLESIREEMAPVFDMTTERDAASGGRYQGMQTVHVHNIFAKTRAVDGIAIDPVLLMAIEGVLGAQFQMSVGTAMCPDPGVDSQGLHQDDGHYPLPRPRPPFIANTLIALDDFTEANGATRIVPGSHLWTKPLNPDEDVICAEMPAGSLLVFDGALWHAGGGNSTENQRRRSINLNFNLSWLRQQENQYIGIPRDTWLGMPERLQRLLGFQKVNFLYGSVDYTDPLTYFKASADAL
jgi:ectoine hydroxylase-related dioxygenase (phytanoyl-CoA dioxygenase family)